VTPYYADDTISLHHGDAATVLADLADGSVACCVTSPPYYGLRDYGVEGQLGTEASAWDYVAGLVTVLEQVRRVLATDGTCWLNLGDSYGGAPRTNAGFNERSGNAPGQRKQEAGRPTWRRDRATMPDRPRSQKNLQGIPWRVAFALQDCGWILRNAIIWHKPNAMPESVKDRLSTRYELIFMLTKAQRYWFNLNAIRLQHVTMEPLHRTDRRVWVPPTSLFPNNNRTGTVGAHQQGKNPGDVWHIAPSPFAGAHFAAFPPEIPRRAILAGCRPGGVVLDPFHGSGTTGAVAERLGHRYVGIDLNAEYLDLSLRTRLGQATLPIEADL